jgi:glycerophosphoryl diester phosphodiesterase
MNLPVRPPIIVNHMAALDDWPYPPNSLEAICACLESGASFIEIDITALSDSDYLLVHDPFLESETSGNGKVREFSAAAARDLHIKSKRGIEPYHVPLLSDVVKLLQDFGGSSRLQLDFKDMMPFMSEEPLRRLVDMLHPLGDRVIVSTGADWQLRRLRTLAPWLDLGLDVQFYIDNRPADEPVDELTFPRRHGAYGYWDDHPISQQRFWTTAEYLADRCGMLIGSVPRLSTFYISHHLLIQSLDDGFNWADMLHSAGIKLDAWTMDADNPIAVKHLPRLLEAGVDQFTTNTPDAMKSLLRM